MTRVAPSPGTADRLRKLGADLGNTALIAVGVGLVLQGSRWGLAVLALAVLGVAGRALTMRRVTPDRDLVASQLAQRAFLAAATALALAFAGDGPAHPLAAALGLVVTTGSIMYEPYLRRRLNVDFPVVAHLPGVEDRPRAPDVSGQMLIADLGVLAAALLLGALNASAWAWLPLVAVMILTRVRIARDRRSRAERLEQLTATVPGAVAEYAPEFAIYTAWPFEASHQVTMWLPYLQRTGRRGIVITRNAVPAETLAALVDVPVIEARGLDDLDNLVPPSLKVAFYPNASSGNGAFVRYSHLTHVFLGHGDSDKPTSYNPTHAMYDHIFLAGPAAVRRYADHGVAISPDKFEIVGRPQMDALAIAKTPITALEKPTVLYAPTWRGHVEETRLSSLTMGERIVRSLLTVGATVIFRPHPFSYLSPEDAATVRRIQRLLETDKAGSRRQHRWGSDAEGGDISDSINASDALVSDVSSVVTDYLFTTKPIVMIAVPSEPEEFCQDYPVARAAYVVRGDLSDLEQTIVSMMTDDPLKTVRATYREDYLGPFPADRYASAFVDAVRALLESPRQDRESYDSEDAFVDAGKSGDADDDIDVDQDPDDREGRAGARPSGYYKRLLTKSRRLNQASAILSLLALATAMLGTPALVTTVLGLVSVAAIIWSIRKTLRTPRRWFRLLGESRATRIIVIGAAVVADASLRGEPVTATLVVLVLTIAVVGEAHIQKAWRALGLVVRNFPEAETQVREIVPRGLLPVASFLVIVVALLVAPLSISASILLVLTVAMFGLFVSLLGRALQRAARVEAAEYALNATLTKLAPQFVVYFASTMGANYQVGMWLPYFARLGRPWIVVTRTAPMMVEIARVMRRQGIRAPIIFRPKLADLEQIIVPSLKAAFYVNNASRNTHLIERRELTHVWLNHGDSEKQACYNPVHAIYDLIFVAGQGGIDRYARHGVHIPREKFVIAGRPQVEVITPARGPVADQQPPTVLYAPTWQGPYADTRFFSLPQGEAIVEKLLAAGARVIFRAHPLNYQFPSCVKLIRAIGRILATDQARTGRDHRWGAAAEKEMTIEECFNASDAMVADVSAVLSDYLHSDKPFAIVSIGRTPQQLLRDAPVAAAAYVLREDLSNLDQVVQNLLVDDPRAGIRRERRIYYLGDFDQAHYADGFLDAARSLLDMPALSGHPR